MSQPLVERGRDHRRCHTVIDATVVWCYKKRVTARPQTDDTTRALSEAERQPLEVGHQQATFVGAGKTGRVFRLGDRALKMPRAYLSSDIARLLMAEEADHNHQAGRPFHFDPLTLCLSTPFLDGEKLSHLHQPYPVDGLRSAYSELGTLARAGLLHADMHPYNWMNCGPGGFRLFDLQACAPRFGLGSLAWPTPLGIAQQLATVASWFGVRHCGALPTVLREPIRSSHAERVALHRLFGNAPFAAVTKLTASSHRRFHAAMKQAFSAQAPCIVVHSRPRSHLPCDGALAHDLVRSLSRYTNPLVRSVLRTDVFGLRAWQRGIKPVKWTETSLAKALSQTLLVISRQRRVVLAIDRHDHMTSHDAAILERCCHQLRGANVAVAFAPTS